jgi:TP901 family phage tail tape measure protein
MAFTLSGILKLDNSGFLSGVKQSSEALGGLKGKSDETGGSVGGLKGKLSSAGGAMKGVAGSALGAVAGIGAMVGVSMGIKDTVDVFANFQKEMSNVEAIIGPGEATPEGMKQLTEKAKEMGRVLPASASDAAQAMANLASSGMKTDQVMDSIEGTLYLATAAQTDMGTAAEITASTLTGFGLQAKDAGHMSDVLAKAAADTNAGILDMGEALKYAATPAKAFGISMEETSAAIGIMSNSGIKGSMAGTTLRNVFLRLGNAKGPAQDAMDAIGFSAYDASGKMKPLAENIGDLKSKTQNLSQEQRNQALSTIFGTEALSGALALIDAGPDKLNELTTSFQGADGAAKQMADTQTNNVYGAMQDVEGAFETLKINIGEQFAPIVTQALKGIADIMPAISDSVGALPGIFSAVWEQVGPIFTAIYDAVMPIITDVFNYLKDTVLPALGEKFNEWFPMIRDIVVNVFTAIQAAWENVLKPAFEAFAPVFEAVVSEIGDIVGALLKIFQGITEFIAGVFTGDWNKAWNGLKVTFGGVIDFFGGLIDGFLSKVNAITGAVKSVASGIASVFGGGGGGGEDYVVAEQPLPTNGQDIAAAMMANIQANANGSQYASGLSMTNERGGEMQVLRNGTSVIPADRTKEMIENKSSNKENLFTINLYGTNMNAQDVANILVPELKARIVNS